MACLLNIVIGYNANSVAFALQVSSFDVFNKNNLPHFAEKLLIYTVVDLTVLLCI